MNLSSVRIREMEINEAEISKLAHKIQSKVSRIKTHSTSSGRSREHTAGDQGAQTLRAQVDKGEEVRSIFVELSIKKERRASRDGKGHPQQRRKSGALSGAGAPADNIINGQTDRALTAQDLHAKKE